MSYSNYPRAGDVVGKEVPSEQLAKHVRLGLIWGSFMTFGFAIFLGFEQNISTDLNWGEQGAAAGAVSMAALFLVIFSVLFAVQIFKWVHLAWEATVRLRDIDPQISAIGAASLSIVPVINLVALIYIMDFLVIRSQSNELPTMNAFSVASQDRSVTWFCYVLCTQCFLVVMPYLSFTAKLFNTDGLMFTVVYFLIQLLSFLMGYKLSVQVNTQLKRAVEPIAYTEGRLVQ